MTLAFIYIHFLPYKVWTVFQQIFWLLCMDLIIWVALVDLWHLLYFVGIPFSDRSFVSCWVLQNHFLVEVLSSELCNSILAVSVLTDSVSSFAVFDCMAGDTSVVLLLSITWRIRPILSTSIPISYRRQILSIHISLFLLALMPWFLFLFLFHLLLFQDFIHLRIHRIGLWVLIPTKSLQKVVLINLFKLQRLIVWFRQPFC